MGVSAEEQEARLRRASHERERAQRGDEAELYPQPAGSGLEAAQAPAPEGDCHASADGQLVSADLS